MESQKPKVKRQKYIIGVDIGGTKIAAGLIAGGGKLVYKTVLATLAEKGVKISLGQIYAAIDDVLKNCGIDKKKIKGIGLCAPGPLDPGKGVVHNPPNLYGWREVPLAALVSKRFKKKTKLENDANAAGIAETKWGAAKGYKNVFYVTVSTGIGTGVIINGKIYHGKNGMAGEGGHVTINYDDKESRCNCGRYGCIEALASGPHTARHLARRLSASPRLKTIIRDMTAGSLDKTTMITISEAASRGDEVALETISEQAKRLGIWLGSIINILDPEIIVIGGGVSMLGSLLFRQIRKAVIPHTINIFAKNTPIVRAKLLKDAGIYGAASLFID